MKSGRASLLLLSVLFLVLSALACGDGAPTAELETAAPSPVEETKEETHTPMPEPTATSTAAATDTPLPTNTPQPTDTPTPTNTPEPTDIPEPTPTPTPVPEPEVFSGTGDAVIDVERIYDFALVHIVGNSAARHMSVKNYDEEGNKIDLLVSTTDPYDGFRVLNLYEGEITARFQIKAVGDWTIRILPVVPTDEMREHWLEIPDTYWGDGDDVVFLGGETPDLATITGNAEERHFAVRSWNGGRDLLLSTTDPYEGTVLLHPDTQMLEVTGQGPWSIEVEAK